MYISNVAAEPPFLYYLDPNLVLTAFGYPLRMAV